MNAFSRRSIAPDEEDLVVRDKGCSHDLRPPGDGQVGSRANEAPQLIGGEFEGDSRPQLLNYAAGARWVVSHTPKMRYVEVLRIG